MATSYARRLDRLGRNVNRHRRTHCPACKGRRRYVVDDPENPERAGSPDDRLPCPRCGRGVLFVFRIVYGADPGDIGGDDA